MERPPRSSLGEDPGWGFSLNTLLSMVPIVGLYVRARRAFPSEDGLVALRQLILGLSTAICFFAVAIGVAHLTMGHRARPHTSVGAALFAIGAASALLGARVSTRLNCTDDRHLAHSFQTRLLVRLAFAGTGSLLAFVAFFFTGGAERYALAVVISLAGLMGVAPTRGQLRRDQGRLERRGCSRSLVATLRAT